MNYVQEVYKDKILDTVYIGGGTPTTLEADQLDRLIAVAEEQSDGEVLMEYIKKGICICTGCGGTKKPEVRCGLWTVIGGARLRASVYCHAAIGKMRRGKSDPDFHPEDVEMMKRLLDVRLIQIDRYLNGEST